jgi:phage protein U
MLFAVLGPILFQAVGSPESLESSRGWNYAEHKTVESTPLLQWIGDELEMINLEILLHVQYSQPFTDRAALIAAAEAHQAMPLVFGNGTHRGWFVITKIAETAHQLADDGSPIAITLKLELKQWAQNVEIDPAAPPLPATPPPALIVGPLAPGESVAGVVAATGLVTFTGTNAGVSAVTNQPSGTGIAVTTDPFSVPLQQVVRADPSVGMLA